MKPKRTARRTAAAAAALALAALTGGTAAATSPPRPADYQAIAHPVAGRVGQTVDVEVGVRNGGPGPAAADRRAYAVTAPEGTTIAPEGDAGHRCAPHDTAARTYLCAIGGDFAAGDRETLRFRIRIDKKVEGAEGWVRILGPGSTPTRIRPTTARRSSSTSPAARPAPGPATRPAIRPRTTASPPRPCCSPPPPGPRCPPVP